MKLSASGYGNNLESSKRIYIHRGYDIQMTCPVCKETRTFDTCVPFLTKRTNGDWYRHGVCCEESEEKAYELNHIGDDYIDVTFNEKFNIIVE